MKKDETRELQVPRALIRAVAKLGRSWHQSSADSQARLESFIATWSSRGREDVVRKVQEIFETAKSAQAILNLEAEPSKSRIFAFLETKTCETLAEATEAIENLGVRNPGVVSAALTIWNAAWA